MRVMAEEAEGVLAAGRARGQAPLGFACPKPLSVVGGAAASRVRCAGRGETAPALDATAPPGSLGPGSALAWNNALAGTAGVPSTGVAKTGHASLV